MHTSILSVQNLAVQFTTEEGEAFGRSRCHAQRVETLHQALVSLPCKHLWEGAPMEREWTSS